MSDPITRRQGQHRVPCRLIWCKRRLCKAAVRGYEDAKSGFGASPGGRGFGGQHESVAYMRGWRIAREEG